MSEVTNVGVEAEVASKGTRSAVQMNNGREELDWNGNCRTRQSKYLSLSFWHPCMATFASISVICSSLCKRDYSRGLGIENITMMGQKARRSLESSFFWHCKCFNGGCTTLLI